MRNYPEFVLASRSPRRRQLLEQAGYRFRVVPPPLPEPSCPALAVAPAQLAEALAYFKARAVARRLPDEIVLGADTVVACGGRLLGKARDADEARRMLSTLSGTRHAVITGLALLAPAGGAGLAPRRYLASETTYVTMRPLSDQEIDRYVASGEWRDKAGAYAIQENADAFVERLEGSFSNVVGLPVELLGRLLEVACGPAWLKGRG